MWINQVDIYVTPERKEKTNGQSAWDAIGDPKTKRKGDPKKVKVGDKEIESNAVC